MRVAPGTLDIAARERDLLFEASVLRDQERKRQDLDALRVEYHTGQAERLKRTMSQLVGYHENEAQKLLEGREE